MKRWRLLEKKRKQPEGLIEALQDHLVTIDKYSGYIDKYMELQEKYLSLQDEHLKLQRNYTAYIDKN